MTVPPWIIDELEEERRRRQEEEEIRRSRIELPLSRAPAAADEETDEKAAPTARLYIVDISPPSDHVIDV